MNTNVRFLCEFGVFKGINNYPAAFTLETHTDTEHRCNTVVIDYSKYDLVIDK